MGERGYLGGDGKTFAAEGHVAVVSKVGLLGDLDHLLGLPPTCTVQPDNMIGLSSSGHAEDSGMWIPAHKRVFPQCLNSPVRVSACPQGMCRDT